MLSLSPATGRPLRVAALGAHCDDIEIGAGGMLLDLAARGALDSVDALVLTSDAEREQECLSSLAAFSAPAPTRVTFTGLPDGRLPAHWGQVKDALGEFARATRPDVVLAPSPADAHQDHRLIGELVRTVFRDHLVLHYEIPKWDGDLGAGRPSTYWPLSAELVRRKFALLDQHYVSQRGHDWWRADTFGALARLRGMECRTEAAEAFSCPASVLGPPDVRVPADPGSGTDYPIER